MPSRRGKRILVVNEDAAERRETAVILSTHGYEVETVSGAAERDPHGCYDLVTLSWSKRLRDDMGAWQTLQHACPGLRFAFISNSKQHLSSVFFNGRKVREAEDSELVSDVRRALSGSARQ